MKKPTILYSTLGVAAVFLILVAVNFLAGRVPQRLDLTAEKAYTLSAGTRAILAKLDTPVKVRLYCTRNENMPPQLKLYAQQVEDLLNEYRQAAKGLVEIQKLNPEPDSDAEDSAKLDGVEGQPLTNGERLYLGLSVSMLDQKEAIPFLSPDRERLLEYDLSRAITRVTGARKQVVGVMSPLPVAGMQMPPMMMMQMGQRGQEPWALYSELRRDYTVKQVEMTATAIPDDINLLVLIHPRDLSENAQYAIDQFVLRGGKLLAFLDPNAVLDRATAGMGGYSPTGGSNLGKLLAAWGLKFDSTQVVADMDCMARTNRGRAPGVLALNDSAFARDDVVTADASDLFLVFPGAFSGTPAQGLKETVLLKSSKNAQLVSPMSAQMSPDDVIKEFVPANTEFPLAVRLTGKFKTAFPEGAPKAADAKEGEKKEDKKPEPPAVAGLKESAQENTVILVGDSDMLQNQVAVSEQQNPFGGGRMVLPANGNLAFAQNAVEALTGDSNLIAVRSRTSRDRPFTVVQRMQQAAEASYRDKIRDLEFSLTDTQRKLTELQQRRQASGDKSAQRFILSPEQQTELENFRKTEASVKMQLKEVRRSLRAKTDALENSLKWLNIAGMPAIVIAAGVSIALSQRKKAAAK
ncbi:MAG: GldG family protein [Chthoniobacteraceae bacterium]|nr:GldG family protein [Chthoniobacteraceae bacterium]